MIIECVKCLKKFQVDSDLIPESGRTIQCGSCKHMWFFNKTDLVQNPPKDNTSDNKNSFLNIKKNDNQKQKRISKIKSQPVLEKIDEIIVNKDSSVVIEKSNSTITLNSIFSFIFVSIISFVALIIILDTFKSPLNSIFPNLELILFNLFESLKDIFLFIKDLT